MQPSISTSRSESMSCCSGLELSHARASLRIIMPRVGTPLERARDTRARVRGRGKGMSGAVLYYARTIARRRSMPQYKNPMYGKEMLTERRHLLIFFSPMPARELGLGRNSDVCSSD